MKIVIPDDYHNAVKTLACYQKLAGHEVTIYNDIVDDLETLVSRFKDAEALVLIRERTHITVELLTRLPNLKLISQTGRGISHIDEDACTRHGVAINRGGGSPHATAELTWALILASMRQLPGAIEGMKAGKWGSKMGVGLRGRTLGIYGYGGIGSIVASYGRAFGMKILVWGREGSLSRARENDFETTTGKDDLFRRSDVLSLHIKLNDETRGLITANDLDQMKPSSLLVNTSRAGLIVPGALESALRNGRPGYAAVDVYEEEPVTDHPLLHMENVICTPHLGYVEKDGYELYFGTAFDQLLDFAAGNFEHIVNPAALEHDRHK